MDYALISLLLCLIPLISDRLISLIMLITRQNRCLVFPKVIWPRNKHACYFSVEQQHIEICLLRLASAAQLRQIE